MEQANNIVSTETFDRLRLCKQIEQASAGDDTLVAFPATIVSLRNAKKQITIDYEDANIEVDMVRQWQKGAIQKLTEMIDDATQLMAFLEANGLQERDFG